MIILIVIGLLRDENIRTNQESPRTEKKGINNVESGQNAYIYKVTCDGVGCYIDLKLKHTYGLSLSELIKELHSMRVGYGSDVEVTCMGYKTLFTEIIGDTCYIEYNHC